MVRLTKIYTRTGDDGTTGLGDFSRTSKTDARLQAYADTDETGAVLGIAATVPDIPPQLLDIIVRVQNDLFDVGADLCVPLAPEYKYEPLRVKAEWIAELEADIDTLNEPLTTLTSFILSGGTALAAHLHHARTVCRRAERSAWAALEVHGSSPSSAGVNPLTAKYLNRLSDLLFVMARYANLDTGDVLWKPGGGRATAQTVSTDDA